MGATFPRIKTWANEIATNTDLNAEFDNILNNLGPAGVDDYSTSIAQMKLQTSPGALGSESLATALSGELERLRYVIQRMVGSSTTYWYEAPPSTLTDLVASLGSGLPPNRIVSGRTTGNSSQLCALVPSGTTASVTLTASVTPFVYYVGGTQYSITANVTLTGLSLAPAANNTCSFNNTAATGQQWTRFVGMYGTQIDVDGMDSGLTTLVGQTVGLKVGNEHFLAYIKSSTAVTNAWRGAMFNNAGANITSVGISDDAEIKLMKLAWIFANTNSSLAVTYTNPTVSGEQPSSANTGDYWLDLATTAWKTFNSTTWVAANATLIGLTMQDTVACVAARTFDSFKAMSDLNTISLERVSNTVLQATDVGGELSVFGSANRFGNSRPIWDMASDLESGLTESSSYTYFAYMKEDGSSVISDKNPITRRDLQGLYHPGETWRCLGSVKNSSSDHFQTPVRTFANKISPFVLMGETDAYNASAFDVSTGQQLGSMYPTYFVDNYAIDNYTVASGGWQSVISASLTPGIWKLSGVTQVSVTGTASAAAGGCQVRIGFSSTPGTPAVGAGLGERSIVSLYGVNNQSSVWHHNQVIRMTTSDTFHMKWSILGTAGATFAGSHRMWAERIDDLTGMP